MEIFGTVSREELDVGRRIVSEGLFTLCCIYLSLPDWELVLNWVLCNSLTEALYKDRSKLIKIEFQSF